MSIATPETVDRGPRQAVRRIHVPAPASDIFALLVNPHRHHDIDGSGTVGAAVSGPDYASVGDTFTVSMKQLGVPYTITSTVTEMVPDRVMEWQHPAGHRWRWELEPLANGDTEVTEVCDFRENKTAPVLIFIGMLRINGRGMEETLRGLRERFDGQTV